MKFNINNWVKVKLTDTGRAEIKRQHLELFGSLKHFIPRAEDAEGWSRWQLHDLMRVLGGDAMPITIGPVPFETLIEIEEDQR